MPTKLEILNRVLDLLAQTRPITSEEYEAGSHTAATWFDRTFPDVVREELRARVWTFSKAMTTIDEDGDAPEFDYMHRYEKPVDCLRLLPLTYEGLRGGNLVPYELFGNFIHTDHQSPISIRYVEDKQDPADWDAGFVAVIIAALAMRYAPKLTGGKINYYQIAQDAYEKALETAFTTNLVEEYPDPIEAHDIIRVRGYDG